MSYNTEVHHNSAQNTLLSGLLNGNNKVMYGCTQAYGSPCISS